MKARIFIWMAMPALRRCAFVLIVLFLFPVSFVRAQDNALLYKEIQLSRKSYTFDELTHAIQKQAGITFTYNASQISGKRHFRIKDDRMTVIKLLAFINKKSGIGYRMVSSGMIIYTPPPPPRKALRRKRKKIVKKKDSPTIQKQLGKNSSTRKPRTPETMGTPSEKPTETSIASTDSVPPQTVVVIGDSATASSYYLSAVGSAGGGGMGNIQMVMRYPSDNNKNTINPYASLNPPGSQQSRNKAQMNQPDIAGFIKKNILLGAAISIDETYYLSPSLNFGFRFLYAHIAYSMGNYPQWRYGLGAQARLNDKWFMRVEFNTGRHFSEAYSYPSFDTVILPPPDSITPAPPPVITENDIPLSVQSRLTRLSFELSRQLTKVISISGGITLNRLKSRYYSNGNPFDIYSLEPPINDAEDRLRTIKPPYLISQSYQPADATGMKLWIGLKISLLFNLSPQ